MYYISEGKRGAGEGWRFETRDYLLIGGLTKKKRPGYKENVTGGKVAGSVSLHEPTSAK